MLDHILTNAALIIGAYVLTSRSWPLHFVRRFLDRVFIKPEGDIHRLYYPVLFCVFCMSSLWGTAFWLAVNGLPNWETIGHLVVHVVSVFGVVYLAGQNLDVE